MRAEMHPPGNVFHPCMSPKDACVYLLSAALLGAILMGNAASAGDLSDPGHGISAGAHHPSSDTGDVRRSQARYVIPAVSLIREDGKPVDLQAELSDGRPVVLNFIYTSCTTICPLSSQIFEQFQKELGKGERVHLMSISIDPEQDTPARLRSYAAKFHAMPGWDHYSGSLASVIAVQTAFNAYRGDKMGHTPLTLMRAAPEKAWVRFDGFARADDLLAERKSWLAAPPSLVER
jgi:protein SCO1/2